MRRSREKWVQIVEQFERSGQSHEAFCTQHRLNVGSFRGWLYRLRSGSGQGKVAHSATRLLPVRVVPAGAAAEETVNEVAGGDAIMRDRGGLGPAHVAGVGTLLA